MQQREDTPVSRAVPAASAATSAATYPSTSAPARAHDSGSPPRGNAKDSSQLNVRHPVAATTSSLLPTVTSPSTTDRARQELHNRRHSAGFPPPWPPGTSPLGQLSSSALPSDSSLVAASYPPTGGLASPLTSHQAAAARLPPPQARIKRSSRQATKTSADRAMETAPVKKPRTGSSPPRRIDASSSSFAPRTSLDGQISPAFLPPSRPKHFSQLSNSSTSDIAASMLSRSRDELASGANVTTLKLPRASISSTPARSGSTPGSLGSSVDVSAPSLSPESRVLPQNLHGVHGVGVIELFEHDDRPTFLVDLANPTATNRPGLNILYHNASLRASQGVYQLLTVESADPIAEEDYANFRSWVTNFSRGVEGIEGHLPYHTYAGIAWTSVTVRRRYRFISASIDRAQTRSVSPLPPMDDPTILDPEMTTYSSTVASPAADPTDLPDYFGDAGVTEVSMEEIKTLDAASSLDTDSPRHPDEFTNQVLQSQPVRSTFDWTRLPLADNLPEHIKFAKTRDWSSTILGPIDEWAYDLRALSNLVMGSPHAAAMYWGPDHICIYNAAYLDLAGQKHPALMGSRYKDAWSEIWDNVRPVFESAWESGQATMKHDDQLFINRNGFLEETFFSWSLFPLVGADGEVIGLYNPAFENTRRRINERRMLTLREIGERTAAATSVNNFWPQVQKGLEYNGHDVPFSIIYSTKDELESETTSLQSGSVINSPLLVLEGSPGVPMDHPAAPATMDLRTSDDGFAPYMRQSISMGGAPVVLSVESGDLPQHLLDNLECRGFGDPCKAVVVFPVVPTTSSEAVTGFIIMGVNPRRPYDDDYKLFIHLLTRQLATSMASVVLFEEEIRRGQRAARLAALDRQELSMQLILRTQEANESEYKFTRMAEFAPVGMFIADPDGHINYCNDMWWQISGHSRSAKEDKSWMDSVRNEDRNTLEAAWAKLLEERVTISVEFRFNYCQQSGENTIDTWVLMSAFPEKTSDGELKSIFGCITDISSQKWAEKVQSERREEAVEMKRQQENFIDITSHEMRNPLSAILQCADQIADNITAFAADKSKEDLESLLEGCLDAANTINLCASHQKRIVDDILTLSKLDSSLLSVTPVDEHPVRVVQHALRMFESELVAHDIEFDFHVDDSFEKHGVEWVKLDPSRLRQVLINLMTNAIKFTQGREKRHINVCLSTSRDVTEVTRQGVEYFDRVDNQRTVSMDIDNVEEWGHGEQINLHCSVEDTGPGLGEEELKLLFQRFQQATPRTHVQYGGSGLGLFISRILTEMQGGQIGVTSIKGSGSKFDFYIQCRKSVAPPKDFERISPFKITRKQNSAGMNTMPPLPASSPANTASSIGNGPLFDVLIVEDNIVNQKVLQRQLNNCGNKTFVANHGREALQTLKQSSFWAGQETDGVDISVILMDLEMPIMDGMTCARKIRELEREGTIVKHVPIIAVTAYARPEQIENAKAAGIDDVISKPFRIPELMPRIEELVSKYNNLSVSAEA